MLEESAARFLIRAYCGSLSVLFYGIGGRRGAHPKASGDTCYNVDCHDDFVGAALC